MGNLFKPVSLALSLYINIFTTTLSIDVTFAYFSQTDILEHLPSNVDGKDISKPVVKSTKEKRDTDQGCMDYQRHLRYWQTASSDIAFPQGTRRSSSFADFPAGEGRFVDKTVIYNERDELLSFRGSGDADEAMILTLLHHPQGAMNAIPLSAGQMRRFSSCLCNASTIACFAYMDCADSPQVFQTRASEEFTIAYSRHPGLFTCYLSLDVPGIYCALTILSSSSVNPGGEYYGSPPQAIGLVGTSCGSYSLTWVCEQPVSIKPVFPDQPPRTPYGQTCIKRKDVPDLPECILEAATVGANAHSCDDTGVSSSSTSSSSSSSSRVGESSDTSNNPDNDDDDGDDNNNTGLIIGLVIACVICVILACAVAGFILWRRRSASQRDDDSVFRNPGTREVPAMTANSISHFPKARGKREVSNTSIDSGLSVSTAVSFNLENMEPSRGYDASNGYLEPDGPPTRIQRTNSNTNGVTMANNPRYDADTNDDDESQLYDTLNEVTRYDNYYKRIATAPETPNPRLRSPLPIPERELASPIPPDYSQATPTQSPTKQNGVDTPNQSSANQDGINGYIEIQDSSPI